MRKRITLAVMAIIKGIMTAEEFAAELDREWAAAIHGANDKTIWIEGFGDE